MIYKKILVGLLSLVMVTISGQSLSVTATENPVEQNEAETSSAEPISQETEAPKDKVQAPALLSEAVMVMDAESGLILYEKNGFEQYMPASTTKFMTALLAVEHLQLDQQITVGPNPPFAEGASMGFKEGEIISVNDLLHALLLHSANDAAEILAEAVSGTVEEFSALMNQKAKELGCLSTHFTNPSGLTEASHKSTPYDLSLISRAVSLNPILVAIEETYSYKLAATNLDPDYYRWATNKNALLNKNNALYYEPAIVAKTGWTPDAGFSHTAVAEKDGKRFVVTVMRSANQKNYWEETRLLFEWAFSTFDVKKVYAEGQLLKQIPLNDGQMVDLVAEKDFYYAEIIDSQSPIFELQYNDEIDVSQGIKIGDLLDTVSVMLEGEEVGTINLISETDVDGKPEVRDEEVLSEETRPVVRIVLGVAGILIVLIVAIRTINNRRRRKNRIRRMYANRHKTDSMQSGYKR